MNKKVPFAKNYELTPENEIVRTDGKKCNLTSENGNINIVLNLYGSEKTVLLDWLKLITHFEVNLKYTDFFKTTFRPAKDWRYANNVKQMMVFTGKHPEYKPGFRIIPCYTQYAISDKGEIWDTYIHKKVNAYFDTSGYPIVSIYDPDSNGYRSRVVHRLVALTWVKNPCYVTFYLVNHLDGNKQNCHVDNLEWTDHSGNSIHAYENGLRTQNLKCMVRDISTGEINEFYSLRSACLYMGIPPKSSEDFNQFNTNRPINGKFEIKLNGDVSPWKFDYTIENNTQIRTKITVTEPNGKVTIIYGYKEFRKLFDLESIEDAYGEVNAKRCARNKGLLLKIEEIGAGVVTVQEIQIFDVQTKEISNWPSMRKASRDLGIPFSTIQKCISRGETTVTNGKAFRYKIDKEWNTNFVEADNTPKCILGIIKNGREYEFKSLREAESQTGINRKTIASCLSGSGSNANWSFRYKD